MTWTYTILGITDKATMIAEQVTRFEREHFQHEMNIQCAVAQLAAGAISQTDHDNLVVASMKAIAVLEAVLTELTTQKAALMNK